MAKSKREVLLELQAASKAAARERAERERTNLLDVAEFLSQVGREAAVAEWLSSQVAALKVEAGRRRERARLAAGVALRELAARGESVKAIAEQAGMSAARIQEYLAVEAAPAVNGSPVVFADFEIVSPDPGSSSWTSG